MHIWIKPDQHDSRLLLTGIVNHLGVAPRLQDELSPRQVQKGRSGVSNATH